MRDEITALAQECYDRAKDRAVPTRAIAAELVASASPEVVAAMASEYLVGVVAAEQRAATLAAERESERQRRQQHAEWPVGDRAPRKGTKARERWERETEVGREFARLDAEADFRQIQMVAVMQRALERYVEDLKMQWTAELLDSTFALRDGTVVTWGEATVEQHEDRRQMFLDNAHANMEGAARHEVAVRELRESGAATLREMVQVPA